MLRIVLVNLLLLLLPAFIYFAYVYLMRQGKPTSEDIDEAPVFWLFAAGLVLMIGAILYFIETSGGKPGDSYRPPVLEDGVIKPGRLE